MISSCRAHTVTLQRIPSHCNILCNETADTTAEEGATKKQEGRSTMFKEAKTITKATQLHTECLQQYPHYNRPSRHHLLSRSEQVTILKLRKGLNSLNHHLFTKLSVGQSELCPCHTSSVITSAADMPTTRPPQTSVLTGRLV